MPKHCPPETLIGQKSHRLLCIGVGRKEGKKEFVKVLCDCGAVKEVSKSSFKTGGVKSCGCIQIEHIKRLNAYLDQGKRKRTHSMSNTSVYRAWVNMKSRCTDENQPAYPNYGGRGIGYCERWERFENFLQDMGDKPEGSTLERLDVNLDYSPDNCVWADLSTQAYNKRKLKDTSSDFRGVYYNKDQCKYKGRVKINEREYFLGYSHDPQLLACRYDAMGRFLRKVDCGPNKMQNLTDKTLEENYTSDTYLFKYDGFKEWFETQRLQS